MDWGDRDIDADVVLDDDDEFDFNAEPDFNPYEQASRDMIGRLENLLYAIRHWQFVDYKGNLETPQGDLGPTSLKMIEARVEMTQQLIESLDETLANMRAVIKITDLHNEWRDWWEKQ